MLMMIGEGFDVVSAILILAAAAIPIYFSFKLRNYFRSLMVMLSIFTLIHGAYHIFDVTGYDDLGENIVEPASYAILIIFGAYYLRIAKKIKAEAR